MNKLRGVTAEVHRLSPAEAEVWLRIEAQQVTLATEVRGRLMGPRCAGRTTIEVAYPLRAFNQLPPGLPPLARRVLIPEPNLWEPERPFVYHAVIELWQDGKCCDRAEFDYGVRMS